MIGPLCCCIDRVQRIHQRDDQQKKVYFTHVEEEEFVRFVSVVNADCSVTLGEVANSVY